MMKILSGVLMLVTMYFCFKHGWPGITGNMKPEEANMMSALGLTKLMVTILGVVNLAICVFILLPQTFLIANIVNAIVILLILALALHSGNVKIALMEIPFLILPLLLIYLGHPLKK